MKTKYGKETNGSKYERAPMKNKKSMQNYI